MKMIKTNAFDGKQQKNAKKVYINIKQYSSPVMYHGQSQPLEIRRKYKSQEIVTLTHSY